MPKIKALFLSIFCILPNFLFADDGAMYLFQYGKARGIEVRLYQEENYIQIPYEDTYIYLYLDVPYIAMGKNVYYMGKGLEVNKKTGQIILPHHYVKTLDILLSSIREVRKEKEVKKILSKQVKEVKQKKQDEIKDIDLEKPVPKQAQVIPPASLKPTTVMQLDDIPFEPIDAIVLDPGHGGKDPGGVGYNGIKEKDVVLSVAKKLYALFEKNTNLNVFITRDTDIFITLEDRTKKSAEIAKKHNSLFVSIHGNISLNKNVKGLEVYTLSDKATDTDSSAVQRIENSGFSDEDIKKTKEIHGILSDLLRDGNRMESEILAKYIYNNILKAAKAPKRGVKSANFYVLRYNVVPATLLEIGFLSNKEEGTKLKQDSYQNQIAKGIYEGILAYINEYNKTKGFNQ